MLTGVRRDGYVSAAASAGAPVSVASADPRP